MARGWASKSVEAQQEESASRRRAPTRLGRDDSRQSERATLMLARSRALADLQLACAPAHRTMLEQAIADLDRRLALIT